MADLLNWIDNADSYVCPKCRAEVDNPAKTEGRCRCGFQDPRYGGMTNRRYLESLSDYDFAKHLVQMCEEETVEMKTPLMDFLIHSGSPVTGNGLTLPTTTRPSSTKSGGCGNARRETE